MVVSPRSPQGHGRSWDLRNFNTSRCPPAAAAVQVCIFQGHGGSWDLKNFSTSRCPPAAAAVQVDSSQGHGGSCALNHFKTSRCPPPAAAEHSCFCTARRGPLQGHPSRRNHRSLSKFPSSADSTRTSLPVHSSWIEFSHKSFCFSRKNLQVIPKAKRSSSHRLQVILSHTSPGSLPNTLSFTDWSRAQTSDKFFFAASTRLWDWTSASLSTPSSRCDVDLPHPVSSRPGSSCTGPAHPRERI